METDTELILQTGQKGCHDAAGVRIPCAGSGQDAETCRGRPWPEPRFAVEGEMARDMLTGLVWTLDANPAEYPLDWQSALDFVAGMNREQWHGFTDWRLPNRRELRSLISHQTRNPALPENHPFENVFLGWCWTSTSAAINPAFAWYVHMEGGRTFYGAKRQYYLVWPVRGEGSGVLPATGQTVCYDAGGSEIDCADSGQDGELRMGAGWPEPRFAGLGNGSVVFDMLTGLRWRSLANITKEPVTWEEALLAVRELNEAEESGPGGGGDPGDGVSLSNGGDSHVNDAKAQWRLPNINELESVVDMGRHSPALPAGHPFVEPKDVYWSSTTSMFEPDWAWALYLDKGAVGVGRKSYARFHVWAVNDGNSICQLNFESLMR